MLVSTSSPLVHSQTGADRLVQRRLQPEPKSTLSQWTTVALLLFVVVDLLAYLYVFSSIFHNISAPSPELEFRTPYRGLDDLYGSGEANSSKHDPIENVPRVAAIVNSEHPDKVYPQDEHRRLTAYGTVTPLDRHLRVSSTVRRHLTFSVAAMLIVRQYHTILQFRVMDYGMERCALALRLPSNEDGDPKSADIELSVLDVSPQLDPSTISWSSRPASRNVVGTLRASSGEEVRLPEFPCRWGSLYAFEVSCAPGSPTCDVDVWADRDGTWGT